MKKTLKKSFGLFVLPLALLMSFSNNSSSSDTLFATQNVKKADVKNPPEIMVCGYSDETLEDTYEFNGSKRKVDGRTGSNSFANVSNVAKGDVLKFGLKSKAGVDEFFTKKYNNLTIKYYNYQTETELTGYASPCTYSTSINSDGSIQKFEFTITTLIDFTLSISSSGTTIYDGFSCTFNFTTSKKDQTGIYVYADNDVGNKQQDGGSFDIIYDGDGSTSTNVSFDVLKMADGSYSDGRESFRIQNIFGGDEKLEFISETNTLIVKGYDVTAQLVFSKMGDETYNDLVYTITLNVLQKLEAPDPIFEDNGKTNLHNTLYNLIPGAHYKIQYKMSDGTIAYDDFYAEDGTNVLSSDSNVDPIYNKCKNKGYYIVDDEQSSTQSGCTIQTISRIVGDYDDDNYVESESVVVNFYVLPRVKMPQLYNEDSYPNGIRYLDSDGILYGLETNSEYEIKYYQNDDSEKLLTYVAITRGDNSTEFDLASAIQSGSRLVSISKRGKSSSDIDECLANSFEVAIAGTVYKHIENDTAKQNMNYEYKSVNSESMILAITGLEPDTAYLLYTPSLEDKDYIDIKSDSEGKISLMNNNLLGVATKKVTESGLSVGGIKVIAIKKKGNAIGNSLEELTSNSLSLSITDRTFVSLTEYKKMLVEQGVEYSYKIGEAALKQANRDKLNDKQAKAIEKTISQIRAIELETNNTEKIQELIDQYNSYLKDTLLSYDGFWGYLYGIEGWVYILIAVCLFLLLIVVILIYRNQKKKYERKSIKIIQKFAAFSPLSLIALYSFDSVGGNFFAPVIIIVEVIFIVIFLCLGISYYRKRKDLERWLRFHDDDGYLLEQTLSKGQIRRMRKQGVRLAEITKAKKQQEEQK